MDILLIDDDEMALQSLIWCFSKSGHHLSTTSDGLKALRLMEDGPVDAIIVNVEVAGSWGVDLLEVFRERFARTPVIATSDSGRTDARLQALRKGAYDFIRKPIQVRGLMDILKRIETDRLLKIRVL